MAELDRGALLSRGVRQGAVLTIGNEHFLVISQDCDISYVGNDDLVIEVIKLEIQAQLISNYGEGRNARVWQFELDRAIYLAYAQEISTYSKDILWEMLNSGDLTVIGRLNSTQLNILRSWRSYRYSRFAWPDEFIIRLTRSKKKIEDVLTRSAPDIRTLLVKLHSYDELPEQVSYKATVFLIFKEDPFSLIDQNTIACATCAFRVLSRFQSCSGIEVADFIETVELLLAKYEKRFSTGLDINVLLGDTSKLMGIVDKLIKSKDKEFVLELASDHMQAAEGITLAEYDIYNVFTDDWMSYKGGVDDHKPGKH